MNAIQLENHEIENRTLTVPQQAKLLTINNAEDYQAAGELLITIKSLRKEIDETFDPIISKAHAAHKEAVSKKKQVDAPLVEAEGILKPRIAAYLNEQEKKRREEEHRSRLEAARRAEEERLAEAIKAEEAGAKEEVEQILNQPTYLPPPVILPSTAPKISGIASRKTWKFEIIDPKLVPDEYKIVDSVKIGKVVRALGSQCRIPGIQVYEETNISAGTR